jgi:glycosyltransferase involved in cell wall biosynthesis
MDKQKMLFLIPSLRGGGAERTLINLLNNIDYNKFEIDLCLVLNKGEHKGFVHENVKQFYLFNNELLVRSLSWIQKKFGITWLLQKRYKSKIQKKYDIGISWIDGNFTDFLFYSENIEKRFSWVHGSYDTNENFRKFYSDPSYVERIKKNRYQRLDGIVFVSNDSKKEFIKIFGEFPVMKVVYNLFDKDDIIKKSKVQIEASTTSFNFVAIGSLFPIKGFDRLIRAAKIVRENGYNFTIEILGQGGEEKKLIELVQIEGLSGIIYLRGYIANPYPYIQKSDVFVMSSISEALPTVLCEAMILGKPTIVTKCSGCSEIVENGYYGLEADQSDISLAECMMKFLENPELLEFYKKRSIDRAQSFDDVSALNAFYSVFQ